MDYQKLFDALAMAGTEARKPYHLSLGALRDVCEANPKMIVRTEGGEGLGREHSYRGYYNELSFEPDAPRKASEVLKACRRALEDTYTGYKGGDYRYDEDTSIWLAHHGCTGSAITGAKIEGNEIVLSIRDSD